MERIRKIPERFDNRVFTRNPSHDKIETPREDLKHPPCTEGETFLSKFDTIESLGFTLESSLL